MNVTIGADHAGFDMKRQLIDLVGRLGHQIRDIGTFDASTPDDYPDFAKLVARDVRSGRADRGILICGSGAGASIAANKFKGIRAAICHDHYSAHQAVEHDDMNVLVLGARIIGPQTAADAIQAFLGARFNGEERHLRRLNKVKGFEEDQFR